MLRRLKRHGLLYYWLPVLLWMGLIFALSSQPSLPSHPNGLIDFVLKKGSHMAEYGILVFLLWRALSQESRRRSIKKGARASTPYASAFVLTLLYALSDEYHQTFVAGRNGRLGDVGVDALGAMLALLVIRHFDRRED